MSSCTLSPFSLVVYIDYLPVPLVSEKKHLLFRAGVDLEIGAIVGNTCSCVPVVVTEVGNLGKEEFLALKVSSEVFVLQSVGIVNVPRNLDSLLLIFLVFLVQDT